MVLQQSTLKLMKYRNAFSMLNAGDSIIQVAIFKHPALVQTASNKNGQRIARLICFALTLFEQRHEKTSQLIRAFVQSVYFLNLKFQACSHLPWLYSPVCARPGLNPEDRFSHDVAHLVGLCYCTSTYFILQNEYTCIRKSFPK